MNKDLEELLRKWEVEADYVENFKRCKINKVSTLKLLTDTVIEKLFPDEGPRLEFTEKLKRFRNATDLNENQLEAPLMQGVINQPQALLPELLLVEDDVMTTSNATVLTEAQISLALQPGPSSSSEGSLVELAQIASLATSADLSWKSPLDLSYDLESVLKSCLNGKLVLAQYTLKKTLTDKQRNLLGDVVISDYLRTDIQRKLSYEVEKAITGHIVNLFPTESKELWVSSKGNDRQRSSTRRKVLSRYYALRRTLIAGNLIPKTPSDAGLDAGSDNLFDGENAFTDAERMENEENDLWLKNNKTPWSKVQSLWERTSKWRVHHLANSDVSIHNYISQYPCLKEPTGYLLLETDFETMFPNSSMKLYLSWPMLSAFILDKAGKKIVDDIESSLTAEGRKVRTVRALPYLFTVVTAVNKSRSKQWRPSRSECADGLILHVKHTADLQTDLETHRKQYEEFGLKLSPIAVMVGQDEDHISSSYVCIDKINYEVDNPIKALDIAFKLTHSLDAEYNVEVLRECMFLESCIFELPVRKGRKGANNKDFLKAKTDFLAFKSAAQ